MSAPSLSNVFSDVYITGNCTVKGTISSLAGSITSQWTTSGSIIYYTSGNVGIGTATPGNILTISSSGVTVPLISSSAAGSASYINFTNSADSRSSFIGQDGTGLFAFSTGALALGTNSSVPIIFAPNYNSGGEKMRITPTGYVGIGTTNPGSLLTVSGGVGIGSGYNAFTAPTGGLIVQGNVGIGTSNPGVNALQVTGNVVTQGFTSNATNTVFNFDTLTVPFVSATQVLASTNIGIGTTNPGSTLHTAINSATATTIATFENLNTTTTTAKSFSLQFYGNGAGGQKDVGAITMIPTDGNFGYSAMAFSVRGPFSAGNEAVAEVMRCARTGNNTAVGIGTTNPQSPLHVNAAVGGNGLTIGPDAPYVTSGSMFGLAIINSTLTAGQSSVIQIGKSVVDTMFISYNYTGTTAANYLAFAGYGYSTQGSLCIRNDGKVGIGTSNPGALLQVQGTTTITGLTTINNNGGNGGTLNLQRGGTFFNGSSDWNHVIYNNGGNFDSQGAFDGLRFVGVAGFQFYCQVTGLNTGISSGTLAMSINNNRQITMPYQPCFRAYYGSGGTADFTTNTILPYNTTQVNIGSHYSTSTYKFTAPVAGRYIFGASTYVAGVPSMWDITTANLGVIARNEWRVTSASQTVNSIISTTTIVELSAADTVWVVWTSDTVRLIGASRFNSFWGHLIG